MTRELKLALIVGFSLVLVVTVLVSDHLSRARRSSLEMAVNDTPPLVPRVEEQTPVRETPLSDAQPATPAPSLADPATVPPPGAEAAPPVELTLSRRTPEGATSALERAVRELGGEIRDGRVYLPPSAGMSAQTQAPSPGTTPSSQPAIPLPPTNGGGGQDGLAVQPVLPPPPAPPAQQDRVYEVQPGDSLYKIAKRELGDGELWRSLVEFNKGTIPASGALRAGMKIKLPPRSERRDASTPAHSEAASKPASSPPNPSRQRTYVVKKGDTLGTIASRELGTVKRMHEILDLNKDVLSDPDMVREGMTLKLPSS